MTSPIRVLRQIVAPNGRHRPRRPLLLPDKPVALVATTGAALDEAELLDTWPMPELVHGAAVATCFDDCPNCDKATAGVLTKDGWRCGECFTPVPAGGAR
ncbi:MAG: hypothetical protein HOQ07_14165 [Sinomonas sp.]|nr:hypothetical protein [Sinomonas sp.]